MSREAAFRGRADAAFHWLLLVLCTVVLLLAAVMSVRGGRQVFLPGIAVAVPELCTAKRFLGIDCPGCGVTRAFIALAHGDMRGAWSYNPAGVWLFAIVAFQVPYRAFQLWRVYSGRPEVSLGYATHGALVLLAVGLVGQWAGRFLGM